MLLRREAEVANDTVPIPNSDQVQVKGEACRPPLYVIFNVCVVRLLLANRHSISNCGSNSTDESSSLAIPFFGINLDTATNSSRAIARMINVVDVDSLRCFMAYPNPNPESKDQ
jgi:hypothetical protein